MNRTQTLNGKTTGLPADTWHNLRHLGRRAKHETGNATQNATNRIALAIAVQRAKAAGGTTTDLSEAAQISPTTVRKYTGALHYMPEQD